MDACPRIVFVEYCLHFDRSMWRQSTDWTRPYRSTFYSHADCHVEDCRTPVCSGHSFLPPHFPAGMTDEKGDGAERQEAERWGTKEAAGEIQPEYSSVLAGTLHTQGVTQGSSLVLPSMLQLQRWQNGKPI